MYPYILAPSSSLPVYLHTLADTHSRRILLHGLATRSLTVCLQQTDVPVHTRRILLPGMAIRPKTRRPLSSSTQAVAAMRAAC
jgi:hypothetical protein